MKVLLLLHKDGLSIHMVKKIVHIFTSLVIGSALVGIPVNLHYCNGNVYSIGIVKHAHSCCDNQTHNHCTTGAENHNPGRCTNKKFIYKTKDDYIPTVKNAISHFLVFTELQPVIYQQTFHTGLVTNDIAFGTNSSPPLSLAKTGNQALSFIQSFLL